MLTSPPHKIRQGDVLRVTEPNSALVECFGADDSKCLITPRCRLRGTLKNALAAFLRELDGYTLADLILKPKDFGIKPAA